MVFDLMKGRVEKALQTAIEGMGENSVLRDACSYALMGNAKRFRPILILLIGEALGSCDVMPAALSVEFFHTASLIADDLPCMDNDDHRRGRPSLHKAFGEGTALLASYTLIAAGYGGIYENGKKLKERPLFASSADKRALICLEAATRLAGLQGATQGQFLDLFPPNSSLEIVEEIMQKKTVSLFEIAFLFGWLFGGGEIEAIADLSACASHLGMAFQIGDDLEDNLQDQRNNNMASLLGREKTILLFQEEIASLEQRLKKIGLWTDPFRMLVNQLGASRNFFFGNGAVESAIS